MSPDSFQLVLGGECCMLPGILKAFHDSLSNQRVGLVYIDADTDLDSLAESSTGFFAGMTMTHLLGKPGGLQSMEEFKSSSNAPPCNMGNTVFFGLNDSLESEAKIHQDLSVDGYEYYTSSVASKDPEMCAEGALKYLDWNAVDVILVHLDVDAIDARTFPLANVPQTTSVTFTKMMGALRVFRESKNIAGLSVAEVNPDHDPTQEMVKELTDEIVDMLAWRRAAR